MFGGLYEDLPPPSTSGASSSSTTPAIQSSSTKSQGNTQNEGGASHTQNAPLTTSSNNSQEWSVDTKLIAPALRAKMLANSTVPRQLASNSTTAKKKAKASATASTNPMPTEPALQASTVDSGQTLVAPLNFEEEYDPIEPNDYEELVQERKLRKKSSKRKERDSEEKEKPSNVNVQFAPPSSYFESDAKLEAEKQSSSRASSKEEAPSSKKAKPNPSASASSAPASSPAKKKEPASSRVIMLTNMVERGDVDKELQQEIEDECAKFGRIKDCKIFEDPRTNIPNEEAVRIFVEFSSQDGAAKARKTLDGRLFAGKSVHASFFEEEKWRKHQFAYES